MKQKIKLWILRIEGWKEKEGSPFLTKEGVRMKRGSPWANFDTSKHLIHEAWCAQFATWKDYLKTKLFWLVFSMILGALFFFFDDNSTVIKNGVSWFSTIGAICFLYPVGWTIYALLYMACNGLKKLIGFLKSKLK
jgi:hypothetical protein